MYRLLLDTNNIGPYCFGYMCLLMLSIYQFPTILIQMYYYNLLSPLPYHPQTLLPMFGLRLIRILLHFHFFHHIRHDYHLHIHIDIHIETNTCHILYLNQNMLIISARLFITTIVIIFCNFHCPTCEGISGFCWIG